MVIATAALSICMYINTISWIGVNLCVRVLVCHGCDVTSATCTLGTRLQHIPVTRTLGTSLLTERRRDMAALSRYILPGPNVPVNLVN